MQKQATRLIESFFLLVNQFNALRIRVLPFYMAQDSNLRFILSTYDLPEHLESRILRIAQASVADSAFDEQYSFVAETIDTFTRPFQDRFARNLDQRISKQDNRLLHELIGTEDQGLRTLIHGVNPTKNMHAYEIAHILETHLEPHHLAFVEELVSHKAGAQLWGFSAESISRNVDNIKGALQGLEQKYGRNRKIILPARPIKHVTRKGNSELQIEFGLRRYNGNPLAFFQEHSPVYTSLSRSQLAEFDRGLYEALRQARKLEIAIPETRYRTGHGLSSAQIDKVLSEYKTNGGRVGRVAKTLGLCRTTVRKYLQMNGLREKIAPTGDTTHSLA